MSLQEITPKPVTLYGHRPLTKPAMPHTVCIAFLDEFISFFSLAKTCNCAVWYVISMQRIPGGSGKKVFKDNLTHRYTRTTC